MLWCGEASYLNTGYAVYAKEVLSRLYKTDKYIIAEMGCYADARNPKNQKVPWRFYPTLPNNAEEASKYNAMPKAQFGEWRFDDICLDFEPDVVIDIRDWWMIEYQERSAFRRFFKWVIMPTVDSRPQQEQYVSTYSNADAVFTYSEFGKDVLEADSQGEISVIDIPSPGANFEDLKPSTNKALHRDNFGFMENINIVGTVMRNQRRKLYPNLIGSFREMLDQHPELQPNTFLYIHTAHPDLGWDIPYFIKKYNMGNHTLFTYKCRKCLKFFPSFYHGAKIPCQYCQEGLANMPTTVFGVTQRELGDILNWFDLYVQYSICEGFGMPQVEAAACGVPVITVRYSAMESVGEKIKAEFIDVASMFWDNATQSERAIPDDKQLIDKMYNFIKKPASLRLKKGMDAYVGVKKHYTWEKSAKIWEKYLDEIDIEPREKTWGSDSEIIEDVGDAPEGLTNAAFVKWSLENIAGMPEKVNTYNSLRMIRDLNQGTSLMGAEGFYYDELGNSTQNSQSPFGRKEASKKIREMKEYYNHWEKIRSVFDSSPKADFLRFVTPDMNSQQ